MEPIFPECESRIPECEPSARVTEKKKKKRIGKIEELLMNAIIEPNCTGSTQNMKHHYQQLDDLYDVIIIVMVITKMMEIMVIIINLIRR